MPYKKHKKYQEYQREYHWKRRNSKEEKRKYFVICPKCKEVFNKQLSRITKKVTPLCRECERKNRIPWNKGKQLSPHPKVRNYKRHRDRLLYTNWHNECLKRDWYRCQICSSKEKLEVHHIKSYKDYPKKRVNIDNGITLCKKCHLYIHNINILSQQ